MGEKPGWSLSYLGALGGVGRGRSYLFCLHQRWVQPPPQGRGGGSHHSESQEGLSEETGPEERDLPDSNAVPGGLWDPTQHFIISPTFPVPFCSASWSCGRLLSHKLCVGHRRNPLL